MTSSNKPLPTISAAIVLTLLFACGQGSTDNNATQTTVETTTEQAVTIETFSDFPPEIDGCSCYFSNDSTEFNKAEYFYVNNYEQLSFLKINGVLTKFTQTEHQEISETKSITKAKSDQYEMIIEVADSKQNGDETWLKTGTITLTDSNGKAITKVFYGECGC